MNRTNGRIAEGSKRKFVEALIKLLKVYSFEEITVTQLSQEAELSRKTYYRLYKDKNEILTQLFEGLYAECAKELNKREVTNYWDLVQTYFDFWESRKTFISILEKNKLLPRLFEYVYVKAYRNWENIFPMENSPEAIPYLLAYGVGGMNGMLIKWVEQGMEVPSGILIAQLKSGFSSHEKG